ncbi:ABC-2 type transport system ATP-binding protein [Orenia metallireducens]|uniref:ABC-2 type transport system ATP-binding protein n=1 Tax=Orenia metallireducens TaxID=1413210 RepID=A0A285HYP1_9FIRM|nr:ATP-binding cassette domain-containing protein [Orenia metallireducens]PRX29306.1 ABC-2 type transport system ATP-binding protein [Orenia metallireducens]SNY40830.1 ABC-2 type transport system ATP-binding protein [Orenia metallireducens]
MIHVKDLKKTYKSYRRGSNFLETLKSIFKRKTDYVDAVKGISFDIAKGELIGFIGPNGAGKSTTLKMLTGVLHPTSGEVEIMGYTPWQDRKKYVANIGAVFGQKSQLIWDIPPIDAFYMNKAIYNIPDDEFEETKNKLVKLLEVEELIKKPTRQLSLGQRMKCEFIMAMLHNPDIVFLDEPTIGLDVIAKETIRNFIEEMNKRGVTFILTTHDLGDIEHLARRVIFINNGEIIFDDSIEYLRKQLGDKKYIKLKTDNKMEQLSIPGIDYKKIISNQEFEIELDNSAIKLKDFIEIINQKAGILDMNIQELPIESAIKVLYGKR